MDQDNEGFEFKPLTEGLGFHKKPIDLKDDPSSFSTTGILPRAKAKLNSFMPQQQISPIPQPRPKIETPAQPRKPFHPEVNNGWAPAIKSQTEFVNPQNARSQRIAAFSWSSGIFDSTMVGGITLVFLGALVVTTGLAVDKIVEMVLGESGARIAVMLLIFCVAEIYSVVCRSFFGRTLGEWAFGFRLGSKKDQQSALYPIQVVWRVFLVIATGLIVLPALSTIFGRDLIGRLTGVSLIEED